MILRVFWSGWYETMNKTRIEHNTPAYSRQSAAELTAAGELSPKTQLSTDKVMDYPKKGQTINIDR